LDLRNVRILSSSKLALLFTILVKVGVPAAAPADDEAPAVQGATEKKGDAEPSALSALDRICVTLAGAAAANELPVMFFMRLVWQESRFNSYEVSRARAQGVAQFMPATARLRGLTNPFDRIEAINKSAETLA
jgi:soluble lytic murein transglycosylase-like protein